MAGYLIAFEGLDQSGKQTQAERLAATLRENDYRVELLSFPDYATPIGAEIGRALRGEREFSPDVMQLLYTANRYEHRATICQWLSAGTIVICDRYLASSIAYGEAHGLDPVWLADLQRRLPQPVLTLLLDISPETSLERKQAARDRYERDLPLLARVRDSYARQSARPDWLRVDGWQDRDRVSAAIQRAVQTRLALRSMPAPRARPQL
jgi:dTMP kinase